MTNAKGNRYLVSGSIHLSSDLKEAIPILKGAEAALKTLKPADIAIVKKMLSPPDGVKLVMEAVCGTNG